MGKSMPSYRSAGSRTSEPAAESDGYHVGAELRDARRRMGVNVETAARDLKIRADYLVGLEQNDHAALPALPYVLGFVRSYATYVGLDPGKLARRFREESGRSPVDHDYTWLKPVEQSRISRSFVLLLSLAIAGAAYTGWYYRTADIRKPATAADIAAIQPASPGSAASADSAAGTPGPPRRAEADSSPPAAPGPSVPEDAAEMQDSVAETAPPEPPTESSTESPPESLPESLPESPPESPPESLPAGPTLERAEADRDRTPNAEAESAVARRTVVLKALDLVWVRVRDPQTRQVIVEGIMKKGNELTVPDKPGLVLDVGRASQLEYLVNGKSAGLAGPTIAVRHNLPLDAVRPARSAAAVAVPETPAPGSGGDRTAAENAEGGTSGALPAAADGGIVLRALGLVWIRVRHPQTRQVVVEGIMKKGNAVTLPDDPGLVLDVGRANQLEYVIGGESAGLAGDSPGPVHNLSLDPERLKRGG
ncbi:MAG: DUF4115 domain-containing protein [Rhodospirillaceae bacterium]|nr:DUF4115 domain-containing protein [Rhodospirillaceae bacterium]